MSICNGRALMVAWGVLALAGSLRAQAIPPVAATSQDLVATFRTNAALADETYTDKRVAVTGHMSRITGTRVEDGTIYLFEMSCGPANTKYVATFWFNDEDRRQLARIKVGEQVTIEGLCKGMAPLDEDGRQAVYFWECKLEKAGK
jgi:hypothetical protein